MEGAIILMLSPFLQKQFQQLRKLIYDKYCDYVVQDQQLLMKQIQVMEECKQKLERRRAYDSFNNISLNITNISSIQNMSSTDQSSFRNRFTEQFQNSILNSAIKEIKSCCSQQTFDTVMSYVMNNKNKEYEETKKELERRNREYEEQSALVIIKQKDITFLQRDLANLRTKEEFLQEEKKKLKRKIDQLDQKEKRLHSAQMSLIFKQKLNLQGKRRYERQKEFSDNVRKTIEKVYQQLDQIWIKILSKMEQAKCDCEPNCWKQQIMKRIKEQLVQQRKILMQQQKQIEIEYDTMRNLSQQIKKVFVSVHQQGKRQESGKK